MKIEIETEYNVGDILYYLDGMKIETVRISYIEITGNVCDKQNIEVFYEVHYLKYRNEVKSKRIFAPNMEREFSRTKADLLKRIIDQTLDTVTN